MEAGGGVSPFPPIDYGAPCTCTEENDTCPTHGHVARAGSKYSAWVAQQPIGTPHAIVDYLDAVLEARREKP